MDWKYVNRRVTLFVATPFNITEDILPLYISEFSKMNLLPSVSKGMGIKLTPHGIEQEEVLTLELRYLDNSLRVNFGPDRVDIESTRTNETWGSFHEIMDKIKSILSSITDHQLVRLALCGSIVFGLTQEQSLKAYSVLFKNDDESPIEWQLRKVLRSELKGENGTSIHVNNVYSLSNNMIVLPGIAVPKGVVLEMDINTVVGTSVSSILSLQDAFWNHASIVINEAVEYYNQLFSDDR